MSFTRPTLPEILKRVKNDLKSELGVKNILRRAFLNVIALAITGVSHVLHGHIDFIQREVLNIRGFFLRIWVALFGVPKLAATFTQIQVKHTGTPATIIPVSTALTRTDGEQYIIDSEATIQTAAATVKEISKIITRADVSKDLDAKTVNVPDGAGGVGFWFDVDDDGTTIPQAAQDIITAGGRAVEVTTVIANDLANNVATKLAAFILTDSAFESASVANGNEITVTAATAEARNDVDPLDSGFTTSVLTQGADVVIGGEVLASYTAQNAGTLTNVDDGDVLTLVSPIVDIDSDATVITTLVSGEDTETDESNSLRLFDRIQEPPSGGKANDYVQEALTVAGVTRAFVFPLQLGPPTVGVTFVQDDEIPIIPNAAKVAEVQVVIDAFRPVTAIVTVFAPTPVPLDFVIKLKPNTQAIREAIEQELRDLIKREAAPAGAFKGPLETFTGTILLSRINEAISTAVGEDDHDLISPVANFEVATGEIVITGSFTFQTLI